MKSTVTTTAALACVLALVGASCSSDEASKGAEDRLTSASAASGPTENEAGFASPEAVAVDFQVSVTDGSWDLVAIGDSFIGWSTLTEQYADLLSEDLGIDIEVHKIANGSSNRLEYLRTTDTAQALLADAEIVVVEAQPGPATAPGMVAYESGDCGGLDNQDCFRQAQADFAVYVEALFDELIEMTPPDTTIIATLVATWGPAAYRPGIEENDPETHRVYVDHVVALQELTAAAAWERSIATVDVSLAFNGPDYYQPAPDGYLLPDRAHLTNEGSRVVAELLHGLSSAAD